MTCTTHHHACDCRGAEHAAEIARLTAEVEGLRKDAERYRWLRDNVQPWRNGNPSPHAIVKVSLGIRDGTERVFTLIGKTAHACVATLDLAIDHAALEAALRGCDFAAASTSLEGSFPRFRAVPKSRAGKRVALVPLDD